MSEDDYAEKISAEAVDYLADVFADEIACFGYAEGIGGSASARSKRGFISKLLFGKETYVWSGPLDD